MEKENNFEITEAELNKIFAYVVSRPIQEAMELYAICMEIGKRGGEKTESTQKALVSSKMGEIKDSE